MNGRSQRYLLYGTPRSGTTFFYQVLAEYFQQIYKWTGTSEYFNVFLQSSVSEKTFPPWHEIAELPVARRNIIEREILEEQLKHLENLKNLNYNYFFKVLSQSIPSEIEIDLKRNFTWIFVERRNLYEQFLSYLISYSTGVYYQVAPLKFEEGSIRVKQEVMTIFEGAIFEYQAHKLEHHPEKIIVYEDSIGLPIRKILDSLDLTREIDLNRFKTVVKQNNQSKEDYISNLEEVRKFYVSSCLQKLWPI